ALFEGASEPLQGTILSTLHNTRLGSSSVAPSLFHGGWDNLFTRPAGNIAFLDVLRSIAIILVYGSHFGPAFSAPLKVQRLPFIIDGWSGVDLFFILSGLLIGTQLWRELNSTGQIQLGRFLLRRG